VIEAPIPQRAPSIFASLRFRDFRLLWGGLMISNLGTWMQFTAMGYYVASLAITPHKAALDLGLLGAARAVPVLLLSPIAGVVADEFPRRRTLMIANMAMALAALLLAVLATVHRLDLRFLVLISAFNASAQAFDSPTRQSWVPLLVERRFVGNAVGLNSVAFNAPAVIGPAIAGLLIVWVGVAGSFYVNAVATLAVVAAVALMRPSIPSQRKREPMLAAIGQGLAFIAGHPVLRYVFIAFFVIALSARPYGQLIPALIVGVLHGGARELGWAVAAAGVGGLAGALVVAYFSQIERRSTLWLCAGLTLSAGVLLLGFVRSLGFALPVLFAIGLGTLTFMGASNTLIQTLSPDAVRGRALSVYTMIAIGIVPLGSLVDGAIASRIGLPETFVLDGALCGAMLLIVWFTQPRLRNA
jgi:MFS family permease